MKSNRLLFAAALSFSSPLSGSAQVLPALPTVTINRLTLKEALRIAAANSVTLKQMQADAGIASASARSASAQTKPSLSTTTYRTVGDSSNILTTSPGVLPQNIFSVPPRGFANLDLMLMVPLFTGGKLENNRAAARQQDKAAQLNIEAAALTVTENVTEGYANAVLQQALAAVAQSRVNAEDEQVRETQEKVRAGRLSPVDLLREQAEQADARQALLSSQNNAQLTLITLKTTLGVSQASQIALSGTLDTSADIGAQPADLGAALHQAEIRRPELAAAERQIEAATDSVKTAQGAYAPQVYGVAMADAMTGQGVGRAGYTVGVTASLPLYDGGQRRAEVDAARSRLERARADALQVRGAVDQQVAAAWLSLQTATAQVQAAAVGVTAAQEGYTLAALRYDAGKSAIVERLDARLALTRAEGTLAQAKADLLIAHAKLQAAIGAT